MNRGVVDTGASIYEQGSVIADALAEVNRVGSDLADLVEALVDGQSSPVAPSSNPPVSIQDAMMQLIVGKVMAGLDGSQEEQSRTIYQQQTQETPNDIVDVSEETPNEVGN